MQGIYGVDALCCFRDADTLGATGHYLDKTRPDVERGRSFGGSSGLMVARNPAGGEPAPSPVASRVVTGVAEVYDSSFTTASTGSTPSGSGSEPLREPREFQITDEELEKLIGENNEPFG